MIDDDATQFSYFRDNELTQLADIGASNLPDEVDKTLEIGTTFLNKYKILKVLGEGSFSLIYLLEANDASKKLLVAKEFFPKGFVTRSDTNEVILKTSLSDKEIENYQFMKDIFIGEAQNLVKVSSRTHPNVLNFFSLEENINNTMYLITDYEEGITLKEYLRERKKEYKGKLNNQEIIQLLQDLLSGLEHIHNVNVYHQDIKLENILIRHDKTPLLLDFGASIVLYDEKRKKYFNATTPRYAAPEQIELAQPPAIDSRSDIYALGVMAYKLITDTFPPKASERLEALDAQKDDPYVLLETQKVYGYDMVLLRAIDTALHLLPEQRFQNTKEFKHALLKKNTWSRFLSLKLLAIFFLPIIGMALYFFWPTAQGTVKLNLKEKTYFVYSDGKKIPISQEKTILLPTGRHQLTFIKDGYIPYEMNTTVEANKITNVIAKLIPSTHLIQLSSNLEKVTFVVNNEPIHGNSFMGKYGDKYTIQTLALDYPSETIETSYMKLFSKHFRFYQKVKSKNKRVTIKIEEPLDIGKTVVQVNNKIVKNNTFTIEDGKVYEIDIVNEYYKPIHLKKSYEELKEIATLNQILQIGRGKVILTGLTAGVSVEGYQKFNHVYKKVNLDVNYKNSSYMITMDASKNMYLKLHKKEYEDKSTEIFSVKNKLELNMVCTLKKIKKLVAEKIHISVPKVSAPAKKVEKHVVKSTLKSKTKVEKKSHSKSIKKSSTRHKKKIQTTKTNQISKKKKHQTIRKKKKHNLIKPKRKSSGSQWYCMTGSGVSATARGKSNASRLAIRRCRAKHKINCHISSCYIWQ